jgi:hypothetical protein
MNDREKQELERIHKEHDKEYRCLLAAEEGNSEPLAELIEREGCLATPEAREYVAARLRGEKKKRGNKRTLGQIKMELNLLQEIRMIEKDLGCTEYKAIKVYLASHPDMNEDSLKTYLKRAKESLEKTPGLEQLAIGVQKSGFSEPR